MVSSTEDCLNFYLIALIQQLIPYFPSDIPKVNDNYLLTYTTFNNVLHLFTYIYIYIQCGAVITRSILYRILTK